MGKESRVKTEQSLSADCWTCKTIRRSEVKRIVKSTGLPNGSGKETDKNQKIESGRKVQRLTCYEVQRCKTSQELCITKAQKADFAMQMSAVKGTTYPEFPVFALGCLSTLPDWRWCDFSHS